MDAIAAGIKTESTGDSEVQIKIKNPLKPLLGSDWMEGKLFL
jgi:hypothetical protein